jgi:hypothetical protein
VSTPGIFVRKIIEARVAEYLVSRHSSDAPNPWHMALLIQELQAEVSYLQASCGSAINNLAKEIEKNGPSSL